MLPRLRSACVIWLAPSMNRPEETAFRC